MSTRVIRASGATTEFIFTEAPFESCHASTIVELRNGDLLAAWFGGSAEGNPDVDIWGSRRTGGRWSAPARLAREPEVACYNPVLFHTRDERIWLYYRFGPDPARWVCGRRWSTDEARTWSQAEHLGAGLYGPIRTKPLILEDGTIVGGTSVESYRSWACWIERSIDHGRSWSKSGPITIAPEFAGSNASPAPPPEVPGSEEWRHTSGIIQPAVVCLGGERLRLYARSTSRTARICVADSFDSGITWTGARPIDLPNPNSGVDAVALRDGRVILVYNHSDRARTPPQSRRQRGWGAVSDVLRAGGPAGRVFLSGVDSGRRRRPAPHLHLEPQEDPLRPSTRHRHWRGIGRPVRMLYGIHLD